MSKNVFIGIGVVIVILLGIGIAMMRNNKSDSASTTATPTIQSSGSSTSSTTPTESPTTETESSQNKTTNLTVHYTDAGYSPNSLEITTGSTVTFVNDSSQSMWTASDPHPVHTDLSVFDAKKGYKKGESYSFTFTKTGTFGYHNHLVPGDTGTIIVK
jgi:plastocyanin